MHWGWLIVAVPLAVPLGIALYLLNAWIRFALYARHVGLETSSWSQVPRMVWGEFAALCVLAWWHLTGRGGIKRTVPAQPSGHPVLCVHGFMQNGTNWVGLRRHLHARGRITEALSMGPPPKEQATYGTVVESRLDALCRDYDGLVDVVCHSMGGIVLRRVLDRRPDLARRLGRVVTIASPHAGTAATRGLDRLPEGRAMARRGSYLVELPGLEQLVDPAWVTALGSPDDTTVYPVSTTRGEGARHIELPGLGHNGMVVYWESLAHVVAALNA